MTSTDVLNAVAREWTVEIAEANGWQLFSTTHTDTFTRGRENHGEEVARILREIAGNLTFGNVLGLQGSAHDVNGNTVGEWRLDPPVGYDDDGNRA